MGVFAYTAWRPIRPRRRMSWT